MAATLKEQVELIMDWLRKRPQGASFGEECARELEIMLQRSLGGETVYVPSCKKRNHLETLESVADDATPQQLSKLLGVSVRRVRQLKRLRG